MRRRRYWGRPLRSFCAFRKPGQPSPFGALGLFALVAFNAFFVAFHRIFLIGDSWVFADTDSLIQFYPQPLWVDARLGIVILTVLEGLLMGGIAFGAGRRTALRRAS